MIHRTRVSGWIPVLTVMFAMFCAWWSEILKGLIHPDPNAGILAFLAMSQTGQWGALLFGLAWMGVTLNAQCPAAGQLPPAPAYPDLTALNADTYTVFQAADGMNWILSYSTPQWRAVLALVEAGRENIPYLPLQKHFTRGAWARLKADLIKAGLAWKDKNTGQVYLNRDGVREVRNAARARATTAPLLQDRAGY